MLLKIKSKETRFSKGERVCAVLLAFLILISMVLIAKTVKVEASASGVSQFIYFDFNAAGQTNKQWTQGAARPAVWWWGTNENGAFAYLDVYDAASNLYVLKVPEGKTCTGFKCLRMSTDSAYTNYHVIPKDTDGLWTQTEDQTVSSDQIFYANCDSNGKVIRTGWYTDTNDILPSSPTNALKGGESMSASYSNLVNDDSATGYGVGSELEGNLVELFPVDAKFYDYLTDDELMYGWRNSKTECTVSRDYRNRIPYKTFNQFVSNYAVDNDWKYPLYFGNFTSQWSEHDVDSYVHTFTDFHYGTLIDRNMYGSDGNMFDLPNDLTSLPADKNHLKAFFRREDGTSPYTFGDGLKNFSIFANDSEPLREFAGSYAGSVLGLVESTLVNNQLMMVGNVPSPYFSDDFNGGDNQYTNIVTTKFPMRVEKNEYKENDVSKGEYTTYEFNSNGKAPLGNKTDIVYFTYDGNGKTDKINYTSDTKYEVYDAYESLGGNNEGDHRGFFPFDHDTSSHTYGKDYGFGMRLDIPFNLTEDGMIMSKDANGTMHKTNIPMEFTFAGDDDVWVFVDGKLALDLGGDHGNAKGGINFALETQSAYVDDGVVCLSANPQYDTSEYDPNRPASSGAAISGKSGMYTSSIANVFDGSSYKERNGKTIYDVSKKHTLTVFYMERGLVESNLKLSFSVSPVGNRLTVDNVIEYDNVSTEGDIYNRVKDYIEREGDYTDIAPTEKFNFEVDETTGEVTGKHYDKTYYNDTVTADNEYTDKPEVDHEEDISFANEIADGTHVTVTEEADNDNKYKYDTFFSVDDNFIDTEVIERHQVNTDGDTVVKGGGPVDFDFQTSDNDPDKVTYNDFSVHAYNRIKVGGFEITKTVQGDSADNTAFEFEIGIKLPHESMPVSFTRQNDGNKASQQKPFVMDGLPIGTTITVKEENIDGYEVVGNQTQTITIEEDKLDTNKRIKFAFVNKKVLPDPDRITLNIEGTKYLDSDVSGEAFQFSVHTGLPCTASNQIGRAENATTGNDKGQFKFTNLTIDNDWYTSHPDHKAVYYVQEETLDGGNYTYDSSIFRVTFDISVDTVNNKLVASEPTFEVAILDTATGRYTYEPAPYGMMFINTTKVGQVEVTKKGSDGNKLKNVTIALVAAEKKNNVWQPITGADVVEAVTNDEGVAVFTDVALGDYVVYEVQAAAGYELIDKYEYVNVTENNIATVEMTDPKTPNLPKTGGIGTVLFITIGILLICAAVYLLKPSKKDIQKAKEKDV
ncbi:MAG: SpaA isopeptide-forming pilin-related protein [Acutalibacteraceae bacterium]|nr:SpaA isopeptide-forming pilin-related protein [Acutalibacteraceae bacterium]